MSQEETLNTRDAMRYLGVGARTFWRWVDDGRLVFRLGPWECYLFDVEDLERVRQEEAQFLTTRQVAAMLRVCGTTLRAHVRAGILQKAVDQYGRWGKTYRFEMPEVTRYWRQELGGRCVRCEILGEATAKRGFMCKACEYEDRTGRIYRSRYFRSRPNPYSHTKFPFFVAAGV